MDESEIQDMVAPQDADQHGDAADHFKPPPPPTAMVRKSTCLHFQYNNLIQKIRALLSAI
jgi:hypothetical protein